LEVPREVLRGVLSWRSLGKCNEGLLYWISLGWCNEGCYLGYPLVVVTSGCYLGGPLGGVTRTTVAATRPTTTRMTKMEMKMPARERLVSSFILQHFDVFLLNLLKASQTACYFTIFGWEQLPIFS
jgi:hypothetical protein